MLTEYRTFFQEQTKLLDTAESELVKPFNDLVLLCKPIMDPVVDVLFKTLNEKPKDERDEQIVRY